MTATAADPTLAKDRAREHYRGAAGATYFRTLDADALTRAVIARERARKIQPFVRPTDRVVEYGVGCGYNLRFVECGDRWGFDLNPAGRDACEHAGIRFVESLDDLVPGSFDVVICHHVLEHVPDPLETLGHLERLARPGGAVLLFVPLETRRRYRVFNPADPNHHLFSWNAQSLGNLLTRSDLDLEQLVARRFSYERRLAPLARWGVPLYRLGLAALRRLRPEDELFARLVRPAEDLPPATAGRVASSSRLARAA